MKLDQKQVLSGVMGLTIAVVVTLTLLFGVGFAWNNYKVWAKGQSGKAQLKEAEFSKQIQLEEAKANLEAEKLNAQAEIERAKGAAEAIRIEGGNLTEEYIQYLWVRNLENSDGEKIYIPTEANLPILEARPTE